MSTLRTLIATHPITATLEGRVFTGLFFGLCVMLFVAIRQQTPAERALVGTWASHHSALRFSFCENSSFAITEDKQPPYTGRYHQLGTGRTLGNTEFALGLYGIQFNDQGDAFYISIDGASSPDTLYYRTSSNGC